MMAQRTRLLVLAAVVLVGWFTFITLTWAIQPLSDSMTVGKNTEGEFIVQRTACGSLFDSSPTAGQPVPVLETPEGVTPDWAHPRPPCELVHEQARVLFGINVAVLLLGLAAVAIIAVRTRSRPATLVIAAAWSPVDQSTTSARGLE